MTQTGIQLFPIYLDELGFLTHRKTEDIGDIVIDFYVEEGVKDTCFTYFVDFIFGSVFVEFGIECFFFKFDGSFIETIYLFPKLLLLDFHSYDLVFQFLSIFFDHFNIVLNGLEFFLQHFDFVLFFIERLQF